MHGTACTPRPRERLWTLVKGGKRIDAELLFHIEDVVEIQFAHEGVMAYARRWPLRAHAVASRQLPDVDLVGGGVLLGAGVVLIIMRGCSRPTP